MQMTWCPATLQVSLHHLASERVWWNQCYWVGRVHSGDAGGHDTLLCVCKPAWEGVVRLATTVLLAFYSVYP